ncbi:MAG: glycine oxidase ThiO [Gammaproteobacteria bacterium]|nr:glycine oxidase ThiO [Gammaproteobacteria bacterium]
MSETAIVIGGGINGLLTARALSQRGVAVTLLEQADIGRAASWAGGGILSPLHPWRYGAEVQALVQRSQALYPALCAELAELTGIDPEWTRSGLLTLGADVDEALAWSNARGVTAQVVAEYEVREIEPAVVPGAAPAFWMPDVGQVRNPHLLQALQKELCRRGVKILRQTHVQDMQPEGAGWKVLADTGHWTAKQVVVTAGAWTARLLTRWASLAITPIKGQMIQLATLPGTLQRIVLQENRYIIPRRDGLVLIGSTLEDVGFETATTPQARAELLEFAQRIAPALRAFEVVRQWAGIRPAAPAGIPYISAHPQFPGLFVNAGQFRNGVVMAPASAQLVVDLMTGAPPCISPTPYSIDRRNLNLS